MNSFPRSRAAPKPPRSEISFLIDGALPWTISRESLTRKPAFPRCRAQARTSLSDDGSWSSCEIAFQAACPAGHCERLQLDELWAFAGMKQKRASQLAERGDFGDAYTFVALDADTKLVPCFHVGRRTWAETQAFIDKLRARVVNRPQITTDAFRPYYCAIRRAFDSRVDYPQQTKVFASELNTGRGRYSPPVLVESEREILLTILFLTVSRQLFC